ncbi:MAG: FxsA family protein [Alphaproteobacteria bacterium]|nr:FxsA family protein [Alphaproteobacteria bacterium]
MRFVAIAVLLALPFSELAAFSAAVAMIGFWPALIALCATSAAGVALLRWRGPSTLRRLNAAFRRGDAVEIALVDALGLVLAAIFLLAPGFVTDLVALPFIFARFRLWTGGFVAAGLRGKAVFGVLADAEPAAPEASPGSLGGGPVIDGSYQKIEPRAPPLAKPSSDNKP